MALTPRKRQNVFSVSTGSAKQGSGRLGFEHSVIRRATLPRDVSAEGYKCTKQFNLVGTTIDVAVLWKDDNIHTLAENVWAQRF